MSEMPTPVYLSRMGIASLGLNSFASMGLAGSNQIKLGTMSNACILEGYEGRLIKLSDGVFRVLQYTNHSSEDMLKYDVRLERFD